MRIFSGLRVILFGVLCAAATLVARAGETVYHSDVVVLGSGAAGLSAAVAAAETGAKVMVLEKMPVVGGSSVFAADYVTAIGKRAEAVAGKELSVESLYKEIVRSGGGRNDPELIEKLLLMTDDAYEWLTSMGASLSRPVPVREGGEDDSGLERPDDEDFLFRCGSHVDRDAGRRSGTLPGTSERIHGPDQRDAEGIRNPVVKRKV